MTEFIDTENKLLVTRSWGGVKMGEGVKKYKLLAVK